MPLLLAKMAGFHSCTRTWPLKLISHQGKSDPSPRLVRAQINTLSPWGSTSGINLAALTYPLFIPKMHRCFLNESCVYFCQAWLLHRSAWRKQNAKGWERFCELVVHTFPQEAGCTVQPAWILLLLPCWGCSPMTEGFKGRRGRAHKSRTREWNEATFRSVLPCEGECEWRLPACPEGGTGSPSLPAALASLAQPRLETPSLIRALSLLKGSEPFKLVTKSVLSLPGCRPLSPRVTGLGGDQSSVCLGSWDIE